MKMTAPFEWIRSLRPWRSLARAAIALSLAWAAHQATAASYYVNDTSTAHDVYCTNVGNDSNTGSTPTNPVASLATILEKYTLTSGTDIVYIDAGNYTSTSNIVIGAQHHGAGWNSRITIQGAGRFTVLKRTSQSAGDCCLLNRANYITISNLTFTCSHVGLAIDSTFCGSADIIGNTFYGNASAGLTIQPSANPCYDGHFTLSHNLFHDNPTGLILESPASISGHGFEVFNNTIHVVGGTALRMSGLLYYSSMRNNIVVAKGGRCFEITPPFGFFSSDYNDLWTQEGGKIGKVTCNGVTDEMATLAEWQRVIKKKFNYWNEAHSFSRDPAFASPGNMDYHLKSFTGRWQPDANNPTGGYWVVDQDLHSPCIDAAAPSYDQEQLPREPQPNGNRLNIGCHSGMPEASKAATGRFLLALVPDHGQNPQQQPMQPIYWNATGQSWSTNDTVQLSYSLDNRVTWFNISSSSPFSALSGTAEWNRPASTFCSPYGCWVRVAYSANASISDMVFLEPHTVFYVNDTSRSGDQWCTAAGNYYQDGLSSSTPLDSIESVISRYSPTRGCTIYVDAGTYYLNSDLQLPNTSIIGSPSSTNSWFRLIGANRLAILDRQSGGTGSCCLRVKQDFARIEGFVCRNAENGMVIEPTSCRNASLAHNTLYGHSAAGIRVLPDTTNFGSNQYEICNNLLYSNVSGLDLQASGSGYHLAFVAVTNNTVVFNNGTGIACGGRPGGTTLLNNIVVAAGSGVCLSVDTPNALAASDFNDLFPYGGAAVARWLTNITNTTYITATSLSAWQNASGLDAFSLSLDPLFVSPGDGNYHPRSASGSWSSGEWTNFSESSPCIDAGFPSSAFSNEPAPNGGRVNLGAYGNTSEASKSPKTLQLLALGNGDPLTGYQNAAISWSAFGSGWQTGDTVRIEYSTNGSNWNTVASGLAPTGEYIWRVRNPTTVTSLYHVRVASGPTASVTSEEVFRDVTHTATSYYVNDLSTSNDLYCTGIGSPLNDGSSPASPLASLADAVTLLCPGDTVYVDTGDYLLASNIVIDASHSGETNNPIRIVGTRGGSVLSRSSGGTDRTCLELRADHFRIEGLTCRSADTGILIDPASCRNASLTYNTIVSNSVCGLQVLPDPVADGSDHYEICNNLLYSNASGLDLQASGSGYHLAFVAVTNNTVVFNNGTGIACGGRPGGTTLLNNIVVAAGAGVCLSIDTTNALAASDFNDLFPYGGAAVARWITTTNTTYTTATSLSAWQSASGFDAFSFSAKPQFVSPVNGDYHLSSTAGSWHNGTWKTDGVLSPCIDAGATAVAFTNEPPPNGGRVNLGAYGNTDQASKSASSQILSLLSPHSGETWIGGETKTLRWSATGSGWLTSDTVRIEYSTDGLTWAVLSNVSSPSGEFNWTVINPATASARFAVRVVCSSLSSAVMSEVALVTVLRKTSTYFVNDSNLGGDVYCSAGGAASNTGTTSNSPLDSLASLLTRPNPLGPGDIVYVDTGTYLLTNNVVIGTRHAGDAELPIRIIGARGASVFCRTTNGTDRACLKVQADHVWIGGFTCLSADTGILVDASTSRHVTLFGNTCASNSVCGIAVKPSNSRAGEEYRLLQNLVVNNGQGFALESGASSSNCLFIVENNTLYNGGTGITLLNAAKRLNKNILKNNIVVTTNATDACIVAYSNSLHYADFNALQPSSQGAAGAWLTGSPSTTNNATFDQWTNSVKAAHNLAANPLFVNPFCANFRLQPDSPCVDAGIISSWMFDAQDADGNPRCVGQYPDLGVYELYVRASVRLFLQGPFLTGTNQMSGTLGESGVLPLTSPYADDPRTVTRIPSSVTDWVLLQFRHATNGSAVLSRSVFLRTDGWLVSDAGLPALDVDLSPGESYYLVVKHRNHLAAMSAGPVAFSGQSLVFNFTVSPNAYFGGSNACAVVFGTNGTPVWSLQAGDSDSDGSVLAVDEAIRESQSNMGTGYFRGDVNLDSVVNVDDFELIDIQKNLSAASPVPQPETVLHPVLRITPARKTVVSDEIVYLIGEAGTVAAVMDPIGGGSGQFSTLPLTWAFVNSGSGEHELTNAFLRQAEYKAGKQTGYTDVIETWESNNSLGRAYINVIGTQSVAIAGQALIIAGRTSAQDTLWPTTDYLADNAYTTLRYRGFSDENIHYLSPELSADVDAVSTFANASAAFTASVTNTRNLFVYLVDHGGNSSGNGYFRLNASETITAVQLGGWLDALQNANNADVTVLLDFCYAGSFLQALTNYTGAAKRIVVSACDTNQPSYFVAGGLVSFSGAFFSGVMLGYDVMQCFSMARSAMSTYQAALLDDDRSGVYTPGDGGQATGTYIGPTFVASGDTPQIGEVCGNQVLTAETGASLWIGSISSVHPIAQAWCLIVPPGHNPDSDIPVTDLPRLDLAYSAANGRYAVTYEGFNAPGTYNVTFYVQDDAGNVSMPRSSYVAQVGYDDRVILVAGGDTNSTAWPAIDYLTRLTYSTLRLRLFTPDHIRVLTPAGLADLDGDGSNDVAGASSPASLHAAIAEWALTNVTDRLTLYLLGEGVQNELRLNATETVSTNELAQWVHDFQLLNPVPVNLVLDFSGAGAYLPALADPQLEAAYPGATRIAIASARAGREALFANGGAVSFSQYLLSGIITGKTLGEAYTDARRAIRRVSGDVRQRAQIDDNLNGVANEKDVDGLLAALTDLGSSFVTGADAPVIGAVLPPAQILTPNTNVTLWASEVTGMYPISNVWCVVTPPNFDVASNDFQVLPLTWNPASARYETNLTSFPLTGSYSLTFYAEDTRGGRSSPTQSEITLADAVEQPSADDLSSLTDSSPQKHTFSAATDENWVRVFLVTNFIYDIETSHLSERLDTVVDLYKELPDGSLCLLDHVDEEGSDLGEYTGLDFTESGWYWARLTPYSSGTNCVGSFTFSVDIPAAAGLNTLIVLAVDDVTSGALPSNSTASVTGSPTKSFGGSTAVVFSGLTNGTYLVTVPTPTNFFLREDPATPNQVQSLTNAYYANPRRIPLSAGGWCLTGFELYSSLAVTSGVVRDAWTHAFLGNAQLAFTATSGSLTGLVADGGVMLTSYRTNWYSSSNGRLPPDIVLGACNWNLSVSLAGYQTGTRSAAVSNVQAGARLDLGTTYLVPTDSNVNQVADSWETYYFGGVMNPTDDSDGDGLDNRSEYLCGTDPTDSNSVLRILAAEFTTEHASLNWNTTAGRSYQVLAVTSLLNQATITTNGPWEAAHSQTNMVWSDTNAPLHKARFYRIRLNSP